SVASVGEPPQAPAARVRTRAMRAEGTRERRVDMAGLLTRTGWRERVPAGPARRGRAAGGRDRSGATGPGPVPARERQPVNDGRTRTGGSTVGRLGSGFVVGGGQCVVGGFVTSVRTVRSLGVALWRR